MNDLFKKPAEPSGPVECLGQTFASDATRREHYLAILREKLQDPAFRKTEGFPQGTDEAILAMSDPPYYTACPNPFLEEFVRHYGKPYDPSVKYSREPQTIDVSVGKTDPLYKAHSYHTKVPHLAIVPSILHYTEPGDLVLDGFAGSGMTGVAAQWCGSAPAAYRHELEMEWKKQGKSAPKWGSRRVILNDLSPAATFIAANYNLPFDVEAFAKAGLQLLQDVEQEVGWMYETTHTDGKTRGRVEFTVWSEVFTCPHCAGEVNFIDEALDESSKRVRDSFPCPHCGADLNKDNLDRVLESRVDPATGETWKRVKFRPSVISYVASGVRREKQPDQDDLALLAKVDAMALPQGMPTVRFPIEQMYHGSRIEPKGFSNVHHFFLPRAGHALAALSRRSRNQTGQRCCRRGNEDAEATMTEMLTDRYEERLAGVLSCYDRIMITGTLPGACYAAGMTSFLNAQHIRIFDYPRFAEPLRERIREGAQALAAEHGVEIQHISQAHMRKEDVVAAVIKQRGDQPGLVHVISAMEACDAYAPWHDKKTHQTFLRHTSGKCLHYYFYFIDAILGLIFLRVPTWCPFRLQFYCNGHSWLARSLTAAGIGYTLADNAFIRIDDWERAQQLAEGFSPDTLHAILDSYAQQCCPVLDVFGQTYHWSLMQVEYSTDLVFRSEEILKSLYEELSRQAIFSVKAEQVATFLGKKITPQLAQEIGSRFATRIEGTCIKHRLGKVSVKMYDKFNRVLRLETTTHDVSFFKHYRKVEHRDHHETREIAPLKKTIYSLIDLREILLGCNRRYLEYLSALDDFSAGDRNLHRLTRPKTVDGHTLKGFNFFDSTQQALLSALQRPEFNIRGICRADLTRFLPNLSVSSITRYLWRLRKFGIIKKVAHSYRYYLTRLGRSAVAAACRITEQTIIPALAGAAA